MTEQDKLELSKRRKQALWFLAWMLWTIAVACHGYVGGTQEGERRVRQFLGELERTDAGQQLLERHYLERANLVVCPDKVVDMKDIPGRLKPDGR
jgi:hypothetical protein